MYEIRRNCSKNWQNAANCKNRKLKICKQKQKQLNNLIIVVKVFN